MFPPGYLLDGKFVIEGPLGEGGMGAVYRARHLALDEAVAVKVIRADYRRDPEFEARFVREAKAARRVVHPNVVAVREFGEARDGVAYLVMDFVEGETVRALIARYGAEAPLQTVASVTAQVASALDAMHALEVVHRDLKPDNVMVCPDGTAKVLDFGIARAAGDSTFTNPGEVVGAPEYISPEQVLGRRADARSDQYLLGLLAYELLCGAKPFRGLHPNDYLVQHARGEPAPVWSHRAGVPRRAEAVFARAFSKEPADRYPSAGAMGKALAVALGTERDEPSASEGWLRWLWPGGGK